MQHRDHIIIFGTSDEHLHIRYEPALQEKDATNLHMTFIDEDCMVINGSSESITEAS